MRLRYRVFLLPLIVCGALICGGMESCYAQENDSVRVEEKRKARLKEMLRLREKAWPTVKERLTLKLIPGEALPEIHVSDVDGKEYTNSDFYGCRTVFNVWYTGCGPCRKEMPELSRIKDEFPDVKFYSLTFETPELAMPVLEKSDFNWTHLFNDMVLPKYMGQQGYPMTIITDAEGKIERVVRGADAESQAQIREALRGK